MAEQSKFEKLLKRNNSKIRQDRADGILNKVKMKYERELQDINLLIQDIETQRDDRLDISPTNRNELTLSTFDEQEFIKKDIEYGIELRKLQIRKEVIETRVKELFEV